VKFGRDEPEDGLADDLFGFIPEDAPGATVPGGDDAVQIFADYGVIRRGDDGGKKIGCRVGENVWLAEEPRRKSYFRQSPSAPPDRIML
jgi:hypothetical protein